MAKKSVKGVLYAVLVACCAIFLVMVVRQIGQDHSTVKASPNLMHFVVITPELNSESVSETVTALAEKYDLQIEMHAFSTVAEQRQMLHLVPNTAIDGILLWPISANDSDYETELLACRKAGIPVVVIDRDIVSGLRNSFISSGVTSDLLVLNQGLQALEEGDRFAVGNRSGSGSNQVVELLTFARDEEAEIDISRIQDMKLHQLAENPPTGYYPCGYMRLEGENARTLRLKYELISLFSEDSRLELFFSLDSTLSSAAASAKISVAAPHGKTIRLICYGDLSEDREYLSTGIIDGIVMSKPDTSAAIGIRYLRDICRGFWVPKTMDSGIEFLTLDTIRENSDTAGSDSNE